MRRPGLFYQFFWRILALLALTVLALAAFMHIYQQRQLYLAWQGDLKQEAAWVARHWNPGSRPDRLGKVWRDTHDVVRLSIADAAGNVVADSDPASPPVAGRDGRSSGHLVGRVPIDLGGRQGTLVLSREPPMDWNNASRDLLFWMAGIVLLAATAFYPMIRNLTRTFERLSGLARRVAAGELGATIEAKGQPELVALTASFNEMSLRLRNEETRRQRLIGDISHELRSPMARLRALGETIERHPAEAEAHIGQLESEIGLMDRLIGDMLQTAQFDEKRAELRLERLGLDEWAEDAFARFRHQIEQAGAACIVEREPSGARVLIDPQRMVQALGNLVENAIKATVGRRERIVHLCLRVSAADWALQVRDNGRGIKSEDLPFVFDRFFRGEVHRGHSNGAGLGLSIARAIVEAHGGSVTVENDGRRGAIGRIRMPRS